MRRALRGPASRHRRWWPTMVGPGPTAQACAGVGRGHRQQGGRGRLVGRPAGARGAGGLCGAARRRRSDTDDGDDERRALHNRSLLASSRPPLRRRRRPSLRSPRRPLTALAGAERVCRRNVRRALARARASLPRRAPRGGRRDALKRGFRPHHAGRASSAGLPREAAGSGRPRGNRGRRRSCRSTAGGAPVGEEKTMGLTIVVGYDGSDCAKAALDQALGLAGPTGKVVITYADAPPRIGASSLVPPGEDRRAGQEGHRRGVAGGAASAACRQR